MRTTGNAKRYVGGDTMRKLWSATTDVRPGAVSRKPSCVTEYSPVSGLKGRVLMRVRDAKTGNLVHEHVDNNVIVHVADLLAAELIGGWDVPAISHLALGVGLVSWNPQNPPPPTEDATQLQAEIFRTEVTAVFIDADTGDPVSPQQDLDPDGVNLSRTYLLDFSVTLATDEAIGALKEMALFGGVAADTTNKGTMINYYTFPEWNKTDSQTLDIIWRISTRHTQYVPEFGTCAISCQETCQLSCQTTCMASCQDTCELAAQ